nr:MAG TPA: hypothetical protein [Caudoviricetes sp.]
MRVFQETSSLVKRLSLCFIMGSFLFAKISHGIIEGDR